MTRTVYTTLLRLLSPLLLAWMWWRARHAGGQWQVFSGRRFGRYGQQDAQRGSVWVHAVSLGETRAAQPLVKALLAQGRTVLMTHMTATGMEEGARLFPDALAQGVLRQEWLPYDFPGGVRRFLAHYRPAVGVLMEREVWPNLMAGANAAGVPMVLASARMSERSAQRTARAGGMMRAAYRGLALACAQTEDDAARLRLAGVRHVRVCGNFKFDVTLPAERLAQGQAFAQALGMPVVAIASTREGEDAMFVQALRQQRTLAVLERRDLAGRLLFLLVPRHPQRFEAVAALLDEAGIPFVRWSQVGQMPDAAQRCSKALVVLGDTVGDMASHYAASQVAIVCGSFAQLGGQNLIEACAAGAPVIVGPHTWNFEQAAQDAIACGAAARAPDAEQALALALSWLEQPELRQAMSQAGQDWVRTHAGAVDRVVAALDQVAAGAGLGAARRQ